MKKPLMKKPATNKADAQFVRGTRESLSSLVFLGNCQSSRITQGEIRMAGHEMRLGGQDGRHNALEGRVQSLEDALGNTPTTTQVERMIYDALHPSAPRR